LVIVETLPGIGTMTAMPEETVDPAHCRAIELEKAHRRAETASAARSPFIATVSHELLTPSRPSSGFPGTAADARRSAAEQRDGCIAGIRSSGRTRSGASTTSAD
jgi:signal transduction histidine kinase